MDLRFFVLSGSLFRTKAKQTKRLLPERLASSSRSFFNFGQQLKRPSRILSAARQVETDLKTGMKQ
jgi:hypothetical protein